MDLIENKIEEKQEMADEFINYYLMLIKKFDELPSKAYIVKEYEAIEAIISDYINKNELQKGLLENIHYDLLLQWVTRNQKTTQECILVGTKLVSFLLKLMSVEKLNEYNEREENSILKQILIRNENVSLVQLFIDNGLKITNIEGINPYFYTLKKGNSLNTIVEILKKNDVPLPDRYWSYIFDNMLNNNIKKEKSYLLDEGEKDFIVDETTGECIWNKIIKHNNEDLIKYIPEEFYKPYIFNDKDLIDCMIENKNFNLSNHLLDKLLKLAEKESDLYKMWNYRLDLVGLSTPFVENYYGIIKQIILSIENNPEIEIIKSSIIKLENQQENSVLKNLLSDITKILYDNKETDSLFINNSTFDTIDKLNNMYKIRRDFPTLLKENIVKYLKSLSQYNDISYKQMDVTINEYNEQYQKAMCLNNYDEKHSINNPVLLEHFKNYVAQLPELKQKKIISIFKNVTESMLIKGNENTIAVIENKEVETENNMNEELKIELFSDESIEKFKKTNQNSQNEIIKDFLKVIPKNKELNQKKTLAKASVLLENIQNLYETFPHFENVIKHIENLMILQDKGDKSFYVPPLLLGGGPGVGKTFFCSTLSKLVNTHFELLNMESMTANFILTGSSAQWGGADTGKIFKILFNEENKKMNPIILLDELEKSCGNQDFGVMNSLLPLLERYTAKKFKDECIPLEMDASYINWFATANNLDKLSAPIKSRFDIFNIPNPTTEQRKSLIKGIYKTVRQNNSWGQYFDEVLPTDSLEVLANLMAPGAARDLRKSITMACSKAIREESKIILPKHIERHDNGEIMPWDIIG